MIEIAIAIGVIGFALVAIIGILPVGLNVQKEAHQDTTISQDGPFFLAAIRNGATNNGIATSQNLDFLTNHVEAIAVITTSKDHPYPIGVTNAPSLTNGQEILGLLSTPEFVPDPNNPGYFLTNYVVARVRGLSGNATEQNGANNLVAFRYYMAVEIDRFNTSSYSELYGANSQINMALQNNLYDIRLKFAFPVVGPPSSPLTGPGRQTYRSVVSGQLLRFENDTNSPLWYFQPNSYSANYTL